jgi:hypothetical protein
LDSITDWLLGLELKPRTTKNYLSIISEVLKYAYQKQYIAESPLERLTDSDRKELIGNGGSKSQPGILTPKESARLLEGARALATKEQGEAFFSIVPAKSTSKLVEFAG